MLDAEVCPLCGNADRNQQPTRLYRTRVNCCCALLCTACFQNKVRHFDAANLTVFRGFTFFRPSIVVVAFIAQVARANLASLRTSREGDAPFRGLDTILLAAQSHCLSGPRTCIRARVNCSLSMLLQNEKLDQGRVITHSPSWCLLALTKLMSLRTQAAHKRGRRMDRLRKRILLHRTPWSISEGTPQRPMRSLCL